MASAAVPAVASCLCQLPTPAHTRQLVSLPSSPRLHETLVRIGAQNSSVIRLTLFQHSPTQQIGMSPASNAAFSRRFTDHRSRQSTAAVPNADDTCVTPSAKQLPRGCLAGERAFFLPVHVLSAIATFDPLAHQAPQAVQKCGTPRSRRDYPGNERQKSRKIASLVESYNIFQLAAILLF